MIRVLAVLVLLVMIAATQPMFALIRRRRDAADLPEKKLGAFALPGAARTWVVFTTPYCASCGPLIEELERVFPADGVVTVDATEHVELARELEVRRAPTVFEIDVAGRIIDRMIGAEAARARLPRVAVAVS